MSPFPGTVEAMVVIVFSDDNTGCSSAAPDAPLEITAATANAQATPRAFIVSALMIVPLASPCGAAPASVSDSGKWRAVPATVLRLGVYPQKLCTAVHSVT